MLGQSQGLFYNLLIVTEQPFYSASSFCMDLSKCMRNKVNTKRLLYQLFVVILKIPLLSLRYLKTLLYYSLLIQHMVQNEED